MSIEEYRFERTADGYGFGWPDLDYWVGVEDLRQDRYGTQASVAVKTFHALAETGRRGHVVQNRVNLEKLDDRDRMVKSLNGQTDRAPWLQMLEIARVQALEAFKRGEPARRLVDVPEETERFLVERVVPYGETSTGHADAGAGKSWLALALGLAVATGETVGPFAPVHVRPVLIADWETRAAVWRRRMRRLCAGAGLPFPEEVHHLYLDRPLVAAQGALRREVERLGAGLVVVDSIAYACGGDVTADNAIPLFNGLRSLGPEVTRWVVSHVSKATAGGDGPGEAYGSVFVKTNSRAYWSIKRDSDADPGSFELAMTQTKVNDGPPARPIGVRLRFEDPDGPVRLESCNPLENAVLAGRLSLPDQMRALLRHGAMSVKDLAAETGKPENQIRAATSRMPDVSSDGVPGAGRGNAAFLRLVERFREGP